MKLWHCMLFFQKLQTTCYFLHILEIFGPKRVRDQVYIYILWWCKKKYKACYVETQGVPHGVESSYAANKETKLIGSWCNQLSHEKNSEDSQWQVMNTFLRFRFMYIILYGMWCVNMARKRQPSTYFQGINYITIGPCFFHDCDTSLLKIVTLKKKGQPLAKVHGPDLLMNINSCKKALAIQNNKVQLTPNVPKLWRMASDSSKREKWGLAKLSGGPNSHSTKSWPQPSQNSPSPTN